ERPAGMKEAGFTLPAFSLGPSSPPAFMPMSRTALAPRLLQLLPGLFLFGIASSLMIRAGIGIAPWDVLAQGIAQRSGWSFGLASNLVSIAVLSMWWPLR